jgi:iron complex transport system substrate-binding protein
VQQVAKLKLKVQTGHSIKGLFILSDGERGLTVAGGNTVPQALFNDAGIVNVAADLANYQVMDNEAIMAANPQIIFVASHRVVSSDKVNTLCQHPAIKATVAGRNCAPVLMESSSALGLSPRYPQALEQMINSARWVQGL